MYVEVKELEVEFNAEVLRDVLQHMGRTVVINGQALILTGIDYANECFQAFDANRKSPVWLVRFEEVL